MPTDSRIMVVDDDAPIRELLVAALEDEGYAVQGISGGREALMLLPDWSPDLVLLDVHMADLDAAAFLEACRRDGHTTFPVLLVSAMTHLDDEAARLGVAHAVSKPFDLNDLVETVGRLLTR
jgi:CheY-like chemotaxis protein